MVANRLREPGHPLYPDAESQTSADCGPNLRGHGVLVTSAKVYRDEHLPECEFVFFWYPQDCEIAPVSKKGHGGRRGAPGSPTRSFYDSWRSAVKTAGFPCLLFHDLRRSAVRNMVEKIGISEKRAMEISGQKTRSCFDRYHIVSLADIQESGQKMDKWVKAQHTRSLQMRGGR